MNKGCTLAPELIFHDCCVEHDINYQSEMPRDVADEIFYQCMKDATYQYTDALVVSIGLLAAFIYYKGVRLFGWMFRKKNI